MENNKEEKRRYNLDYIKECEEKYSTSYISKHNLHKFYKDYLKIGEGKTLPVDKISSELEKLYNLISNDEFKQKYGHEYNIIDMYLTTNFQVRDLLENYTNLIHNPTSIISFIKKNVREVDNIYSCTRTYNNPSKITLSSRFYRPCQKGIDNILDLNLMNYNPLEVSLSDVNKVHIILLDLNEKYGVKYDDITFYLLLKSYLNGEIDSYYKVAEDYKKDLDRYSHVQRRCIPLLTRREIN